ncbi:MAG: iron-containing alcohol dehydrogenase [Desulfobacteraceae bacterium]|nr:iron-containing alcohol dehydrogenase [Desulfobacteraceae bacterium]
MINEITRFSFPTMISFGPGAVKLLPENLVEVSIKCPLIVTDPGLLKTQAFKSVESVLKDSDVPFGVFSGIGPNPLDEDIEKAMEVYTSKGCDGVIGLGGGSALDAAKVIPVLAVNGGKIKDYDCGTGGNQKIQGPLPQVIAIPTTAGTGSEVGRCSVISSASKGSKYMICHPLMMPALAILDPELSVSLPDFLTASTGMDALTHCVESLTAPVFHPMCDGIAIKGIEIVVDNLEKAVKNPEDITARGYMLIAAMMGAVSFQKDLGAAHSLSHALSSVCGLQHGLANAICLVPVMEYNIETSAKEYAKVADCFHINTFDMTDIQAAKKAIKAIADLNLRIEIPGSLKDAGVREDQLVEIAAKAFVDPCHQTNPRPCREENLLDILKKAF